MVQRQPRERFADDRAHAAICLVTESFPPALGGLAVSARRLAEFLRDAGFSVHVVVPTPARSPREAADSSIAGVERVDDISVHRVGAGRSALDTRIRLQRCVFELDKEIEFDLFHGFFLPAVLPCLAVARRGRRPVIASIRGTDASTLIRLPLLRPALLDALRQATWVVSVNRYYLDQLGADVDLGGRSSVIHNGFPAMAGAWTRASSNRGWVGTSGEFRAVKDIPLLVRAFHAAAPQASHLLLVGAFSEPAEERWSRTLLDEFGLIGQLEITGRLDHGSALDQLRRMHVYVQSSAFEGVPNALLEAAAFGLPVVATAVGGVPEIFTHGVNALLVPHGDPTAMGHAIRAVLQNDRLADDLRSSAAQLAQSLSSRREREAWVDLHRRLLADACPLPAGGGPSVFSSRREITAPVGDSVGGTAQQAGQTPSGRDLRGRAWRGEIWGISTCFNPVGYANRYEHIRRFSRRARQQGLRLLLIEAAFEGQDFALDDDDADCVVRVRAHSVLWQKERLLNIALRALPARCDKVIWLDGDLLFENVEWVGQTAELLQDHPVVQCFQTAHFLEQGQVNMPTREHDTDALLREEGAGFLWNASGGQNAEGHTGFAWAAQRELLLRHGFYDRAILGGADAIMFWAMIGCDVRDAHYEYLRTACSPALYDDIVAWSSAFHRDVAGRVGCTPGRVFHLWHGRKGDRRYASRMFILRQANFDPASDIALDAESCWRWNSDKPLLRSKVQDYFRGRKEDGPSPSPLAQVSVD